MFLQKAIFAKYPDAAIAKNNGAQAETPAPLDPSLVLGILFNFP